MRWLLVLLVACKAAPPPAPGSPEDLAIYLRGLQASDGETRAREVASWKLDEPAWRSIIVQPFVTLWPDYARAFDPAPLVAQLEHATIATRRHFAGDPALSNAQARLRWAVPTQYPSVVADGIDTVFVYDGAHWRVLAGLDEAVIAHVRSLDAACAERVLRAGPKNRCSEVAWVVADAALEANRIRFGHACRLAQALCGNESSRP